MTTEPAVFEAVHTKMIVERPAPGVVVLRIEGHDVGELGERPFSALERAVDGARDVELYIDARGSSGASIDVSSAWALWLGRHREHFAHVSMLTRSRFVQLTAEFVRKFADLTDTMRLYTDEKAFDDAIAASATPALVGAI
jgi:hypothetical protein